MSKKKIYKLHKWSGITLGFLMFLMAVSGVSLTFREELLPNLYPKLFHIHAGADVLPLSDLYTKAQAHVGNRGVITNIYGAEDPQEAYLLLYKDPARKFPMMLTMNPFTGDVVGEMPIIKNFFAVMLFLHSNFFLGKAGSYLVGISGLILLFFILSGLYIWVPQASLWGRIKETFTPRSTRRTQKIHHTLGILFSIPLLISAITGFLTIFDVSYLVVRPLKNEAERVDELERKSECTFQEQHKVLMNATPLMNSNLISVHLCTVKNGLMKISYGLRDKNFLNGYARVLIDPKTQKELQSFNSEKDPSSWNLKRLLVYPLHTGEFFGMLGRVIVLISGFALAGMFITGLLLFKKRRRA
jgi:sulfite reductase (NADPH) flavoprotein alpha-component